MVDCQKAAVDLLGMTEGRDKLMKGLSAAMRVVGEFSGRDDHKKFASSLSEGRSILRLAGVSNNIVKLRDIAARSTTSISFTDAVMVVRLLGDAVYSVHDNLAYTGRYLKWDSKVVSSMVARGFVGMFWGFLAAVIVDLYTLATMDRASPGFKRDWRARVLMLTRNFCDLLAALSNVKYIKFFSLNAAQSGALGVVSASISTYENWNKATALQGRKAQ